jgi:eukaryotic translation initiation factor 2C
VQIVDLKDMATELINKWGKINRVNPERIIFYRDGVSEGQFDEVCRREVAALRGQGSSWLATRLGARS